MKSRRENSATNSGRVRKKRKLRQDEVKTPSVIDPSTHLQEELGFTLITSSLDRSELVEVKKVNIINQYGVYTKKAIEAETILGEYTGNIIDEKNFEEDNGYYMNLPGNKLIDARKSGNFTRLINHSENAPNVIFCRQQRNKKTVISIKALINIPMGKQLLVNYGEDYQFTHSIIYLNWDDNSFSANYFYQQNKKSYDILSLVDDYPLFNVKKGDKLAFPKLIMDSRYHNLANYPIFKIEDNLAISYKDFDCISPLTWAVYAGNIDKVSSLLKYQADINRQQHQSGLTPLHLAFLGYKETNGYADYLLIIKKLIENDANLFIADKDENTAFHYAVQGLNVDDFEKIVSMISNKSFEKLLQILDKEGDDLVLTAIKNKKLDNLTILLRKKPNYFIKSFEPENKTKTKHKSKNTNYFYSAHEFKAIIDNYTLDEALKLLAILKVNDIPPHYISIVKDHITENELKPEDDIVNKPHNNFIVERVKQASSMDTKTDEPEVNVFTVNRSFYDHNKEVECEIIEKSEEIASIVAPNKLPSAAALKFSMQPRFFNSVPVGVLTVLEEFAKNLEILKAHQQQLKDNYASFPREEKADKQVLKEIQKAYLDNQAQAAKLLYKLCKYHAQIKSPLDLMSKKIIQLKENFSELISDKLQINYVPELKG